MTCVDRSELISVIMPAYNSERSLEEAVKSVLEQTYNELELIIVDDASTDKTLDICKRFAQQDARVRIITNDSNLGRRKARARAIDAANGEWIALLDSDDLWTPDKLEKQIRLRDESQCDLVFTGSAFIDADGVPYKWIMHVPGQVGYRKLLKQNIISNSSVIVRKRDYIKYSPLDNSEELHEDYACWLGMLKDGHTACGIDEPLLIYRVSKDSVTGNKKVSSSMNMNTYKYIGLGFFSRFYYQMCYAVNGIKKHRHFR